MARADRRGAVVSAGDTSTDPRGTKVRGFDLWAARVTADGWSLVDRDGTIHGGPYRDERAALYAAESLTDTRGT